MLGIKLYRKRHALVKPNLAYWFWLYGANFSGTLQAMKHAPVYPDTRRIKEILEKEGIVKDNAAAFLTSDGVDSLAEAKIHLLNVSRSSEVQDAIESKTVDDKLIDAQNKPYLVNLLPSRSPLSPDSAVVRVALDAKLLEIIAGYLGTWPRLYGVNSWLNFPTGDPARASQLWHRDPEDLKIIKVFIYLVDVGDDGGPFTFIPKTHSFGEYAGLAPKDRDGIRILDKEMDHTFPPEKQFVCTGPADTMILADTVGFHRGGNPRSKNRILLTFAYTSSSGRKPQLKIAGEPSWDMNDMQRMAI